MKWKDFKHLTEFNWGNVIHTTFLVSFIYFIWGWRSFPTTRGLNLSILNVLSSWMYSHQFRDCTKRQKRGGGLGNEDFAYLYLSDLIRHTSGGRRGGSESGRTSPRHRVSSLSAKTGTLNHSCWPDLLCWWCLELTSMKLGPVKNSIRL